MATDVAPTTSTAAVALAKVRTRLGAIAASPRRAVSLASTTQAPSMPMQRTSAVPAASGSQAWGPTGRPPPAPPEAGAGAGGAPGRPGPQGGGAAGRADSPARPPATEGGEPHGHAGADHPPGRPGPHRPGHRHLRPRRGGEPGGE